MKENIILITLVLSAGLIFSGCSTNGCPGGVCPIVRPIVPNPVAVQHYRSTTQVIQHYPQNRNF